MRTGRTGRSPPARCWPGTQVPARPASPAHSRRCAPAPTPEAVRTRQPSSRRTTSATGPTCFHVTPSRIQRTEENRVSSIPSRLVGAGSGNQRVAAATNARCAVGHDTCYSAATSDPARFPAAIAQATLSRSRSLTLTRGRIARLDRVNHRLGHSGSPQTSRRFRHHSCTDWPLAGRSLIRLNGRSLTRPAEHPIDRARRLHRPHLNDHLDLPESIRATFTTSNSSSIPNSTAVASAQTCSWPRCWTL
jgi:hypothetical protein